MCCCRGPAWGRKGGGKGSGENNNNIEWYIMKLSQWDPFPCMITKTAATKTQPLKHKGRASFLYAKIFFKNILPMFAFSGNLQKTKLLQKWRSYWKRKRDTWEAFNRRLGWRGIKNLAYEKEGSLWATTPSSHFIEPPFQIKTGEQKALRRRIQEKIKMINVMTGSQ